MGVLAFLCTCNDVCHYEYDKASLVTTAMFILNQSMAENTCIQIPSEVLLLSLVLL